MGIGCVWNNDNGEVIWLAARLLRVQWDVFMVESVADRFGVMIAKRLGFSDVVIESDALNVISALHSKRSFRNGLSMFYNDIRSLLHNFNLLLASHIKRVGNCVAHLIARLGPQDGSELLLRDNFSQGVLSLSELNLNE